MKYLLTAALMAASVSAQAAETIDCGEVALKTVYVQADREDGSFHANKMLLLMGAGKNAACSDITFAYLENNDDAYDSTLSMAISAYMAGKKLRVVVEDAPAQADAKRIAWVNFGIRD
ncbi:hypothetical protein [Photobacterium galatheae]|uniref:DUF3718 domain-containing protein n=1 Tax=Photobacterium galatheae TaxID=1654360 RepID=A0A066RIW5_9GAMM|nr:hypothetical protein [Photobacterium galatheae]KDM90390.1 hypothetical protein EA58_16820 [Photobacterium galatheae]MCM0147890.1 hypothetical protein [Photobacterium galatheae]